MLVELDRSAEVGAVEAALRGLGQWTTRLLDEEGRPRALRLAPHSARAPAARLRAIPGVRAVLSPEARRPRVEAQAGRASPLGRLVAGPCAVESEAGAFAAAALAARAPWPWKL